ncbi:MAG TPA: DUF58 domain-containing protein, partial [Isosphaeraceae bacterium]
MRPPRRFGRLGRGVIDRLRAGPRRLVLWTKEGLVYLVLWVGLLAIGIYQQINLVLLTAGMAAGPIAASWFVSAAMLRPLQVRRRGPSSVFSGEPLVLHYTLENARRWTSALAIAARDRLVAVAGAGVGSGDLTLGLFFPGVGAGARARLRWEGPSPARGRYRFEAIDLITRAPFGLLERRVRASLPGELVVYPSVGRLTRRWRLVHREAAETRRGVRRDRVAGQQEYHGLRDYRPGDSPRWIHWRTTARMGEPMVKEFEQQNEQDLAILIDPWLPRARATTEQHAAVEDAIRFAATACLESSRQSGRRLLLGWTGPTPGVRHGPASAKLLHEFLERLAVLEPAAEGSLAGLLDLVPASLLRSALLVVVSTRPINLNEELERSPRLAGGAGRGLAARVLLLDAARGDL